MEPHVNSSGATPFNEGDVTVCVVNDNNSEGSDNDDNINNNNFGVEKLKNNSNFTDNANFH